MTISPNHTITASNSGAHPAQRPLRILLATDNSQRANQWRDYLAGERFVVHDQPTEFTSISPPEVIVTDQTLAAAEFTPFQQHLIHGEVAVVLIGRNLPADVVLSAEPSRKELRLACQLLAQVVLLRRQNRSLTELVPLDPLTGLHNRRALEEELQRLADSKSLVFALFDLDQFKTINTNLGLLKGDEVLRKVAATLKARTLPYFTARYGGDEFVLVANIAARETALALIEDCRKALSKAASLTAERPIACSAGVVLHPDTTTFAHLLSTADLALRTAKQSGGKQTVVA